VAYCRQYDSKTDGFRFLVYGTKYNGDCTYGIGVDFSCITTEWAYKYCPKDITARHLDDD